MRGENMTATEAKARMEQQRIRKSADLFIAQMEETDRRMKEHRELYRENMAALAAIRAALRGEKD